MSWLFRCGWAACCPAGQAPRKTSHALGAFHSDLYDLRASHIEEAFVRLGENDTVIGPAEDGGYYLLGQKELNAQVFINKSWGTSTVLEATLGDLKFKNVHLLEKLNDIDTFEDLKNNSELIQLL